MRLGRQGGEGGEGGAGDLLLPDELGTEGIVTGPGIGGSGNQHQVHRRVELLGGVHLLGDARGDHQVVVQPDDAAAIYRLRRDERRHQYQDT